MQRSFTCSWPSAYVIFLAEVRVELFRDGRNPLFLNTDFPQETNY